MNAEAGYLHQAGEQADVARAVRAAASADARPDMTAAED